MKKFTKRILALLLSALMAVGSVTTAFASEPEVTIDTEMKEDAVEVDEENAVQSETEAENTEKATEGKSAEKLPSGASEEESALKRPETPEEETKAAGEVVIDSVDTIEIEADSDRGDEVVPDVVEEIAEITEGDFAIDAAVTAPAMAMFGTGSSLGDLWSEKWDTFGSDPANKPLGTGSEEDPYVIDDILNLIWLSYNTSKGLTGAANEFYVLNANIDYSSYISDLGFWRPIGWYVNAAAPNDVFNRAFKGHFDGKGYTISGIDIIGIAGKNLQNVGLFGVIDGGEVKNLTVEADTICGYDFVGILAGQIKGAATITNVTVKGSANAGISVTGASASAHVGGITGNLNGTALTSKGAAVIENCTADNVVLNSAGANSTVGGIAGTAANAYIVDSDIHAGNQGFQGAGYVGGIAGAQTATNIYGAYIDGTIGGNNTIAAGGVTGEFKSGEIFLVQMDGEIGATNKSLTHEGVFVGTRAGNTTFVYGTNKSDNAGYLFYNEILKGDALCGSGITGDAQGTPKSAETGFWQDNELKYTVMEGSNTYPCADDRFFYEELESGVRYIITQKLNRKFSVDDYANGLRFSIDHYAPGVNGSPVKGHLLTIPMINAQNSPADLDVAYFQAIAGDGSIYYKAMDKDSCAAVAAGTLVKVTSSARNKPEINKFFQRVVDDSVSPEKVKRPTYTDSSSGRTVVYDMDYQTGGTYTFTMPDSDSEINIFYELVLSGIWTEPDATTIRIVETRTGNRKVPQISWTVTNENGDALCSKVVKNCPAEGSPITWQLLENSELTTVPVAIRFNSQSETNRVQWSVDDPTLINMSETTTEWTQKSAQIKPEVTGTNAWLLQILSAAEEKQKNNNYSTAIDSTVYEKTAVLTAATDPDHSINNISAYAHCDVKFTFQIIDQTTLLTEGVTLDRDSLTFDVTRKVSGNRRAPITTWEITGGQSLLATVIPADADVRAVTWEMAEGDARTSLTKTASGIYDHDLAVSLVFDGKDINTLPAWMKELYEADNQAKAADLNYVMCKNGQKKTTITVTATDKELEVHTADCEVTVNYNTEDTTADVTGFTLDTDSLVFSVTRNLSGDRTNPKEDYVITSPKKITGSLAADAPFLENVTWEYESAVTPAITKKLSGTFQEENLIGVNFDPENIESAPAWIGNVIRADDDKWKEDKKYRKRSAEATVTGYVTATANDVTLPDGSAEKAKCLVTINFKTNDETVIHPEGVEMNPVEINKKLVIEKTGDIRSSTKSVSGFNAESIRSQVLPNLSFTTEHSPYNRAVKWTVSDEDVIGITQEGVLTINQASKWIRELQSAAPYKGKKTVYVYCTATDNGKVGATVVNLDFETICVEEEFDAKNVDLKLTATGSRSNPTYTWTGADPFNVTAKTYPDERNIIYSSSEPSAVSIDANGKVTINTDKNQQWIKDALAKSPYAAEKTVTLTAKDGSHVDTATVKISFSYKDSTYSSSSSGGSGGGGGGFISGGGTSVGSGLTKTATGLPSYVISGTWVQSADGTWRFSSGRTYTAEWAAVYNPYAVEPQAAFDWFRFDENSVMVTGWFTDPADGNVYYLWPVSDNTLGHMTVGYQLIDGIWYYFNEKSDGTRGKLMRSATVTASDGKMIVTDASGRIISVNGAAGTIDFLKPTPNTTESLRASGVIVH